MYSNLKKYSLILVVFYLTGCADMFAGLRNDIMTDVKTTLIESVSGTKIGITPDNTPLIVVVGLYLLVSQLASTYKTKLLYRSRPDENK